MENTAILLMVYDADGDEQHVFKIEQSDSEAVAWVKKVNQLRINPNEDQFAEDILEGLWEDERVATALEDRDNLDCMISSVYTVIIDSTHVSNDY